MKKDKGTKKVKGQAKGTRFKKLTGQAKGTRSKKLKGQDLKS